MIRLEKEIAVLEKIDAGLNNREIARQVEVSHDTVAHLRDMLQSVDNLPAGVAEEVVRLLRDGHPIGAIEIRTLTPRRLILAIRRRNQLVRRRVAKDPCKCPTCNAMIYPERQADLPTSRDLAKAAGPKDEILLDLVALNDLRIVSHPLVHDLAKRARRLFATTPTRDDDDD